MEMGLVMSQHFLENFSEKNSGVEFWWDSSPLILDEWKESFLKKLDKTKKKFFLNFFNNLISENNPGSQFFLGATTNPVLAWKVVHSNKEYWKKFVQSQKKVSSTNSDRLFWALYREIAKLGAEKFLPLYEFSKKQYGYISVQMDIRDMHDSDIMIEKAEELAEISPNIMIKVPGTAAGYEVIEKLTGKGIPTNNTLCFVYSQIITCADAIRRGYDFAIEQGVDMEGWRSVITHMEGRFGEDLESQAKAQGVYLNEGELRLAELAIFKKAYRYIKYQGILTKLLSCSLRIGPTLNGKQKMWHLEHKRGSNIVVTCPPLFLERLTLLDLEYADNFSIDDQISPTVMEKLLKITSFVESYEENGFSPEEYSRLPVFEKTKSEHLLATMEFLEFVS
jgi:transaldolase